MFITKYEVKGQRLKTINTESLWVWPVGLINVMASLSVIEDSGSDQSFRALFHELETLYKAGYRNGVSPTECYMLCAAIDEWFWLIHCPSAIGLPPSLLVHFFGESAGGDGVFRCLDAKHLSVEKQERPLGFLLMLLSMGFKGAYGVHGANAHQALCNKIVGRMRLADCDPLPIEPDSYWLEQRQRYLRWPMGATVIFLLASALYWFWPFLLSSIL